MARVFIGLGSNLGNRERNLNAALAALREEGLIRPVRVSRFLATSPVGGPPQPDFLNAVAEAETDLPPEQVVQALLAVESRLGRVRTERWGPRIIDLDLLLYDQIILDRPDCVIPHPRMHERRFVLEPLCEIAPDAMHPVFSVAIRELLRRL